MQPLDDVLGGGFRQQHLVLMTGRPGVGKTITALQWARSCARRDAMAIYVCYEHSPQELLARLFAARSPRPRAPASQTPSADALARRAQEAVMGNDSLEDLLVDPTVADAYDKLRDYSRRLRFVEASGRGTNIDALDRILSEGERSARGLFVDYLQRSRRRDGSADEADRTAIWRIAQGLAITATPPSSQSRPPKGSALEATVADARYGADQAPRMYEADVALNVQKESHVVSKTHLAFDGERAEQAKRYLVVSVEKNRSGASGLDLELAKDFADSGSIPTGPLPVREARRRRHVPRLTQCPSPCRPNVHNKTSTSTA